MKKLMRELGKIQGGRVLDIATRYGEFAFKLKKGLAGYDEIIAGDCSPQVIAEAQRQFPDCGITFRVMDGYSLEEEDESFDVVCISNSLHHLREPEKVLREMKRVLKTDGYLIVNEMYSDHQDPAQTTHLLLHTLGGEIDTILGEYHGPAEKRDRIIERVGELGLKELMVFDDYETDPMWDRKIAEKVPKMMKKVEKVKDVPGYESYVERAKQIEKLYDENGVRRCTQLVIIGKK